jgi:hypothetical protein
VGFRRVIRAFGKIVAIVILQEEDDPDRHADESGQNEGGSGDDKAPTQIPDRERKQDDGNDEAGNSDPEDDFGCEFHGFNSFRQVHYSIEKGKTKDEKRMAGSPAILFIRKD